MSDKNTPESDKFVDKAKVDKHDVKENKKKIAKEASKSFHSALIESLRSSTDFDIERFRLEVGCEQLRNHVEEITTFLKNTDKRSLNARWTRLNRSLDLAIDTMAMIKQDMVESKSEYKDDFLHSKLMHVKEVVGEVQTELCARKIQEAQYQAYEEEQDNEDEQAAQVNGKGSHVYRSKRTRIQPSRIIRI